MIRLTAIELYKIFRKGRTYISFIITGFIVLIVQGGMRLEGQSLLDMILAGLSESFIFEGKLLNGYFTSYMILNLLFIHIPILIALVTGDLIAGEANAGTFRLLLTRPVSRAEIIISKFLAGTVYSASVVAFLAAASLGLGLLLLGTGDLIVMKSTICIFAEDDILWRFGYAYVFGAIGMSVVAALSFFLSSMASNSIGPIIGTAGIMIILTVLASLDFGFFRDLKPYLFTTHIGSWSGFFEDVMDKGKILKSAAVLAGHTLAFFGLAMWHFGRKDVLS